MKGAPAQVGQAPGACYAVTMLHSEQDLYLEKALKMDESISLFSLNYTSSHDGCRGPLTFCISPTCLGKVSEEERKEIS